MRTPGSGTWAGIFNTHFFIDPSREIGVVVMGDSGGIEEGQVVKRTGDILSVPVGDGYLGRTVDALGRPIDNLGDITDIDERRPLELQAAGVMDR